MSATGQVDAVIIVPPFASITRPSLAAHVLQACARAAALTVDVSYANLDFARQFSESAHEALAFSNDAALWGERIFAHAAYGTPLLGRRPPAGAEQHRLMAEGASTWVRRFVAKTFPNGAPAVVGASSCFEQTAAAIAILAEVKRQHPRTVTILGGSNCEGEMADGIESIGAPIDFIFSGESEDTFAPFLAAIKTQNRPTKRVVRGRVNMNLDALPRATYDDFFEQKARYGPVDLDAVWLPYESSRGCWWGQKHHCTFCGLNGAGMVHRQRAPEVVLDDLEHLRERHGVHRFMMVDNIMPQAYFRTFLPHVQKRLRDVELFYEQKSNLDLDRVWSLRDAGCRVIQPGIESLSTPILRLMDKGVTAPQNVALLRYARAAEIAVNWNFLYGFPDDDLGSYEAMVEILPDLVHLHPPSGCFPISIDRFSPYLFASESYGIEELEPVPAYQDVLPDSACAERIAYHFRGRFESGSIGSNAIVRLDAHVAEWRRRWADGSRQPTLTIGRASDDVYVVVDTRELPYTKDVRLLDRRRASEAMTQRPLHPDITWALEARLGVAIDGTYVPLAVAERSVFDELDGRRSRRTALAVLTS